MGFDDQGDNFPDILTLQKIRKFRIARTRSGQSLAEYGLALSLVAITCLGALMLVGTNLGGILSEIRMLVTGQSKTEVPASGSLSGADGQTASAQPSSSLTKTCYSNGWCLNLTQNQMSQLSTPQTAGANGTGMVSSQADVLLQLAQQAANDPTLDPALKDLLTKLANSGHATAEQLNTAMTGYSSYYQVPPAGETGGANWVAFETSTLKPINEASLAFMTNKTALFDYLNQSGNTIPPELIQVLTTATTSIEGQLSYMGIGATAYGWTQENWDRAWEYEQDQATVSSDVVIHQESNTICNNGGDTSQCIQ